MKMKRIQATKKNQARKKKTEKMGMTSQRRRWIQTKVETFFITSLAKYMIRVGGSSKV
jgi:hypothetical protein